MTFETALAGSGLSDLFRLTLDLDRAREAHVLPTWDGLKHDEWLGLTMLMEERSLYEQDRMDAAQKPTPQRLAPPPRTH